MGSIRVLGVVMANEVPGPENGDRQLPECSGKWYRESRENGTSRSWLVLTRAWDSTISGSPRWTSRFLTA